MRRLFERVGKAVFACVILVALAFGATEALTPAVPAVQQCEGCAGQLEPHKWCDECCNSFPGTSECHFASDICICGP